MAKSTSSNPLIDRYFKEASRYPLPTEAEEHANFTAYTKARDAARLAASVADREALEKEAERLTHRIACGYLRFVVDQATKRTRKPELLLELIGEGNIGLMRAIKKFDPTRGFRFTTYAAAWVKVHVGEHLHKLRAVNIPSHTRKESKKKGVPVEPPTFSCVDNITLVAETDVASEAITNSLDVLAMFSKAGLSRIERLVLIYTYGLRGGEPLQPERITQVIYGIDGTQMTLAKYEAAHLKALKTLREHLSEEQVLSLADLLA